MITLRESVSESGGVNTIVDVKGTAQTGGTIARLGQRLVASAAKMMQDRFFACMQGKLEALKTSRPQDLKTSPAPFSTARRANTGIIAFR